MVSIHREKEHKYNKTNCTISGNYDFWHFTQAVGGGINVIWGCCFGLFYTETKVEEQRQYRIEKYWYLPLANKACVVRMVPMMIIKLSRIRSKPTCIVAFLLVQRFSSHSSVLMELTAILLCSPALLIFLLLLQGELTCVCYTGASLAPSLDTEGFLAGL